MVFITEWLGSCRRVSSVGRYVPFFPDWDLGGQMIGCQVFNGFSSEIVDLSSKLREVSHQDLSGHSRPSFVAYLEQCAFLFHQEVL